MCLSSQQPSDPAYYIEDSRILESEQMYRLFYNDVHFVQMNM